MRLGPCLVLYAIICPKASPASLLPLRIALNQLYLISAILTHPSTGWKLCAPSFSTVFAAAWFAFFTASSISNRAPHDLQCVLPDKCVTRAAVVSTTLAFSGGTRPFLPSTFAQEVHAPAAQSDDHILDTFANKSPCDLLHPSSVSSSLSSTSPSIARPRSRSLRGCASLSSISSGSFCAGAGFSRTATPFCLAAARAAATVGGNLKLHYEKVRPWTGGSSCRGRRRSPLAAGHGSLQGRARCGSGRCGSSTMMTARQS